MEPDVFPRQFWSTLGQNCGYTGVKLAAATTAVNTTVCKLHISLQLQQHVPMCIIGVLQVYYMCITGVLQVYYKCMSRVTEWKL